MGFREGTQHHGCMGITTKAALKEAGPTDANIGEWSMQNANSLR